MGSGARQCPATDQLGNLMHNFYPLSLKIRGDNIHVLRLCY